MSTASSQSVPNGVPDAIQAPPARDGRLAAARALAQALAFSVVAWVVLLGAVFSGNAGVVTQTMAAKLAVGSLHLQRQAGTFSSTRSARRDQAQLSALSQVAAVLQAVALDDSGGDLSAHGFAIRVDKRRSPALTNAAAEPQPEPRYRAPPARAPPTLA